MKPAGSGSKKVSGVVFVWVVVDLLMTASFARQPRATARRSGLGGCRIEGEGGRARSRRDRGRRRGAESPRNPFSGEGRIRHGMAVRWARAEAQGRFVDPVVAGGVASVPKAAWNK